MSDHNCHQEVLITKIDSQLERIQDNLKSTVSWKVFVFLFTILGGLGFYGNVMTNNTHTAISKINEKLAVIEYKLESHFKTSKHAECEEPTCILKAIPVDYDETETLRSDR